MNNLKTASVVLAFALNLSAYADQYILSYDGAAVVRIIPTTSVSAGSFPSGMLPAGWTATVGSGGSISVLSYDAANSAADAVIGPIPLSGAQFSALYDNGSALLPGEKLEWVQVVDANVGTRSYPALDNAQFLNGPFYDYTDINAGYYASAHTISSSQLPFYDLSGRQPEALNSTNPVTWSANLYPVVQSGSNIVVHDGISWGWEMKSAVVGDSKGTFVNPYPANAVTSGLGTSTFTWGDTDRSYLNFSDRSFDTKPETSFVLGSLTYHNGTSSIDSLADSVDFSVALNFANVPELNFSFNSTFSIDNTVNSDDPTASADSVYLGNVPYVFNVREGATATVNVLAKISVDLTGVSFDVNNDPGLFDSASYNTTGTTTGPKYILTITGFENPTTGGFVTSSVPEPSFYGWLASCILVGLTFWRKSRNRY